jgi:hypothetical protein
MIVLFTKDIVISDKEIAQGNEHIDRTCINYPNQKDLD